MTRCLHSTRPDARADRCTQCMGLPARVRVLLDVVPEDTVDYSDWNPTLTADAVADHERSVRGGRARHAPATSEAERARWREAKRRRAATRAKLTPEQRLAAAREAGRRGAAVRWAKAAAGKAASS